VADSLTQTSVSSRLGISRPSRSDLDGLVCDLRQLRVALRAQRAPVERPGIFGPTVADIRDEIAGIVTLVDKA
jgi:hypothetical protein